MVVLSLKPPVSPASTAESLVFDDRLDDLEGALARIFHVDTYGAVGDGVTDDYDAFQAATVAAEVAGGTVLAAPGKTYLLSKSGKPDGVEITPNAGTRPWVTFDGQGAKIKLSANTGRFLRMTKTADHQTFKYIRVRNWTVDAAASTKKGFIGFGNGLFAGTTLRSNFEDIEVDNFDVINMTADFTSAVSQLGILINIVQAGASEATQNWVKRLSIRDCDFYGGNTGVAIIGSSTGVTGPGYNMWLDDIECRDCNMVRPAIIGRGAGNGVAVWGADFQFGSLAHGGRLRCRNLYGYGSGDVSVEVDAFADALVEHCVAEEAAGYAFYATNFNFSDLKAGRAGTAPAANNGEQKVVFRNCHYRRISSRAYGSGFRVDAQAAVTVGRVKWDNCTYFRDTTETGWDNVTGEMWMVSTTAATGVSGPFEVDVKGEIRNLNFTSAAGATFASLAQVNTKNGGTGQQRVTGKLDMKVSGTRDVAASALTINGLTIQGTLLDIDLDVTHSLNVTNVTASNYGVEIGDSGTNTIGGRLKLRVLDATGDATFRALQIRGTSILTLRPLLVEGDFSALAAGQTEINWVTDVATNAANTVLAPWTRWKADAANSPQTVASVAGTMDIPASQYVNVTGTASITSINACPKGTVTNLKFAGAAATTGLVNGSNLKIGANFVYTADDVIALTCDGTNWYRVAVGAVN